VRRLAQIWRGEIEDEYGTAAVISTAAIALQLLGKADTRDEALALASRLWEGRSRDRWWTAA
jgi:anthranilate phosphoribosyltransferase